MLLLVAFIGGAIGSCKCNAGNSSPQRANADGAPSVASGKRTYGPIEVADVAKLFPDAKDFSSVRMVYAPKKAGGKERIVGYLCFDGASLEDTWKKLEPRLVALGWRNTEQQDQVDEGAAKRVFAAQQPPFNLTGELVRTDAAPPEPGVPECLGSKDQTLAMIVAYRLVPAPAASASQ